MTLIFDNQFLKYLIYIDNYRYFSKMSKKFVILKQKCYTYNMIEIPKKLKDSLKEIGFDFAEQQSIFYLFKNGLSNIADIAKGTNLPRSTIHLAIEQLIERGVLGVTITGKRRMVYIEKPEKLIKSVEHEKSIVNKKMAEIDLILPELRTFFALRGNSEQIDIEHFEGEDGFIETFFRSLDQEKYGEVLRISGATETFTVGRDRLKVYGTLRRKKNIIARMILQDSPMAEEEKKEAKLKLREVRTLPQSIFNTNLHVSIWKNHVSITIWDQGLRSIIITNKSIYEFFKMIFENFWQQAK